MKALGIGFAVLCAALYQTPVFADECTGTVEAKGAVVYKMPSGELVDREVTLVVPKCGKGEISMKYGSHTTSTSYMKVRKVGGRTIFNVVFLDPSGAPKNTAALFKGSYLRGTNYAVYYGDFFSKAYATDASDDDKKKIAGDILDKEEEGLTHYGGFYFRADVPK